MSIEAFLQKTEPCKKPQETHKRTRSIPRTLYPYPNEIKRVLNTIKRGIPKMGKPSIFAFFDVRRAYA